jgi:hypothetical protein
MEFINELSRWCHRKLSAKTGSLVTYKSSAKTSLLVTEIVSKNYFNGWRLEWSANTFTINSEIINENWVASTQKSSTKLLSWLMLGFVSAHTHCWLENHWWKLRRCRPRNHQHDPVLLLAHEIISAHKLLLTKKLLTKIASLLIEKSSMQSSSTAGAWNHRRT